MTKRSVNVGTTFTYNYADANPTWTVVGARGRGTWDCRIEEDLDYAGATKVFSTEEILSARNLAAAIDSMMSDHDTFWASRSVGEVLHYHNGFGQFVRGEVVEVEGEKLLLPTSLVGNWTPADLAHYHVIDGTPVVPYYCRKIMESEPFQPNYSYIYEADNTMSDREADPRSMLPLNATLAAQSPIQALAERITTTRREAARILNDLSIPADEALAKATTLLGQIA